MTTETAQSKKNINKHRANTRLDSDGTYTGLVLYSTATGTTVKNSKSGFTHPGMARDWARSQISKLIKASQAPAKPKAITLNKDTTTFKQLSDLYSLEKQIEIRLEIWELIQLKLESLWEELVYYLVVHEKQEEEDAHKQAHASIGTTKAINLEKAHTGELDSLITNLTEKLKARLSALARCGAKTQYQGTEAAKLLLEFIRKVPNLKLVTIILKTSDKAQYKIHPSGSVGGKPEDQNILLYYLDKGLEVGAHLIIYQKSLTPEFRWGAAFGLTLSKSGVDLLSPRAVERFCRSNKSQIGSLVSYYGKLHAFLD